MFLSRRRRSGLALAALASTFFACKHDITGPGPSLDTSQGTPLAPHLVCNAQHVTPVDIAGSGFSPLPLDTATQPPRLALPYVDLDLESDLTGTAVAASTVRIPDDPYDVGSSRVRWTSQQLMAFDVDATSYALPEGIYGLTVTNRNGSQASVDAALAVVPPPTLISAEPMAICVAQGAVMLQLTGTDFLQIETSPGQFATPTVTLTSGTLTRTYTATVDASSCTGMLAPATDADRCTRIVITIPQNDVTADVYAVQVTNPPPADCHTTEAIDVEVVPPPDLTAIDKTQICASGGTLTLTGTAFRQGAGVTIGTGAASTVTVSNGGTTAVAQFAGVLTASPTPQDVTITNPEGCSDTLPSSITVVPGPILFWVDPSVAYDGITTQLTLYVSGLTGMPQANTLAVHIVDTSGTSTQLSVVSLASPSTGNYRIQATLPAGTAVGVYDVQIDDPSGCPAFLPDAITVTDALDATITAVDPPFADPVANTAVVVDGAGFGGAAFNGSERLYITPDGASPTTPASALGAVAKVTDTRLSAVVPGGLTPTVYDLILVTSDGHVAVLDKGLTVTSASPPVVDSMTPAEVDNGAIRTVTVRGSGFDAANATATWTCRAFGGTATTTPTGTVVAGGSATQLSATIDATALNGGDVCVLRLHSGDGSYADYSALAITLASSNVPAPVAGTTLGTGRRSPGLAVGHTTRAARFLHAIGGDDGTTANALATVESVSVDAFGVMGPAFTAQRYTLPSPRTHAPARRLGDYIYLVGGSDGTNNLATVLRAEVLDPLDAPRFTDLAATRRASNPEPGLGAGVWYYRVAAVFAATDPRNPGGESLPSDPFVVQLPTGLPDTLFLTLDWNHVPNAVKYRVYRSPTAGAGLDQVQLIAEVDDVGVGTQSFVDKGNAPITTDVPLPSGSLGQWASVATMSGARAAPGVAVATDPTTPSRHYLYAFGGRDATNAPRSDFEYLGITVNADGTHIVDASFTAGATTIGTARSELGVFVMDALGSPVIGASETWLYVGPGLTGTAGPGDNGAARVMPGGSLCGTPLDATTCTTAALRTVDAPTTTGGYAYAAANNFLYIFGGGPTPSASAISVELCGSGAGGCSTMIPDPPDLSNWNNQGVSLGTARYLPGSATEGSFIYIVGGVDGTGTALSSSERDVL